MSLKNNSKETKVNSSSSISNTTFTNINSTLEKIYSFLEIKSNLLPIFFLTLISILFITVNAPISIVLVLLFLFLPSFILFHYIMKNDSLSSTLISIPFSFAFNSTLFSLSLVFSKSATMAWYLLGIGWFALLGIFYVLRTRAVNTKINLNLNSDGKTWFQIFVVIIIAFISYRLMYGSIVQGDVLWGSSDANWQTEHVSYFQEGNLDMPPYLNGGIKGYSIEAYTPAISLMLPYAIMSVGNFSSHTAQEIILYLGFCIMCLGIFTLLSKLFGTSNAFFSAFFAILPISFFILFPDIMGMWRLTLFNYIIPWAILIGFSWLESSSIAFIASIFFFFCLSNQTFISIILIPSYLSGVLRERTDKKKLALTLFFVVFVSILFYFTFIQMTFKSLASEGKGFKLEFGFDKIAINEVGSALSPNISDSYNNLTLLPILCAVAVLYLCYVEYSKSDRSYLSPIFILFITLLLATVIGSGLFYFGDQYRQYVCKIRYTLLEVLVFPLTYLFTYKYGSSQKLILLILCAIFLLNSISVFNKTPDIHFKSTPPPLVELIHYFHNNTNQNDLVMYIEPYLGQNLIHKLHRPYEVFPTNITNANQLNSEIFSQPRIYFSAYNRYGLFDVRYEPLPTASVRADYVISYSIDQIKPLNTYIETNNYTKVYSNSIFVVYRSNSH